MCQHFLQQQYDIIAINETNKNWKLIPHEQRPWRTLTGIWQSVHINMNHNTMDLVADKFQPGGTGVISTNSYAHRVMEKGKDSSGLGRWSYTKYRGKDGMNLVVISVYRPVVNTSGESPNSTWNQHKRHFSGIGLDINPREKLLQDLGQQMRNWYREGSQLIVFMDANEYILSPQLSQFFQQFQMNEAILKQHADKKAPPTRYPGSTTIDGAWASSSLSIIQAGYSAFCDAYFDHRSSWIDVTCTSAFGHLSPALCPFVMRKLKLEDPKVVKKYNTILETQLTSHNIGKKLKHISKQVAKGYELTESQQKELELMDKIRIEAMVHAEAKCRKLKMGGVAWSPDLQTHKDELSLWECAFRIKVLKAKISIRELKRRENKCEYTGTPILDMSIEQIKQNRKQARKDAYTCSKDADTRRQTFMVELAQRRANEGNSKAEKQLKSLMQREISRQSWRRIRHVSGKTNNNAVTMVEIDNDDGTTSTLTNFIEINLELQRSAASRLIQSSDTPFMQPPLNQHFNTFTDNLYVQQLLDGTYTPPDNTDPYAKIFLTYLQQPHNVPAISTTWTKDQYRLSWQRRREKTSSGDASTHMGHFKAGVRIDYICSVHNDFNNIINSSGYSLKRLQRSLDIMIPKKAGSLKADKMRLINLVQPCFNQLTALNSYRFMKHAEKHHLMAPEQFGSRKNLSAIMHATNKTLMFDYLRITKTKAIICANDAKSCYDRIVLMAAFLCLRRMGLQAAPIRAMFTTIQKMRHFTSSAFGTSTNYYDTLLLMEILNGILQGNCFGPGTWAAVSTPLLDMLRGEGFGMQLQSPLSNERLHIAGFSFVDDTDVVQTSTHSESRDDLIKNTQKSINLWEGGLRTTGGALVPSKSDWTLVDFEVKNGEWKYTPRNDTEKLSVLDSKRGRYNLKQLDISTGRLTLGVYIAGDGNWKDEIKYLTKMSQDWAEKVRVGQIHRKDAWMAFRLTIRKSLDYCLQATYLTKKDLQKIHSAALCRGLSASGIIRSLDRTICYAPFKYQGLGLHDPYIRQGVEHIKFIMQQAESPSISGKLLRFTVEGTKLETGLPGNLFHHDFNIYGRLATQSWVKATWQFVWEYNISLEDSSTSLPLLRHNDRPIILDIMNASNWTNEDIKCIKKMMMYLDVYSRSDIICAEGNSIRSDCFQGHYTPHSQRPSISKLPCIVPDKKDILKWRSILMTTFKLTHMTSLLPFKLGEWNNEGRSLWNWFYSEEDNRLYHRIDQTHFEVYSIYLAQTRRSSRIRNTPYIYTSTSRTLPPQAKEATIFVKHNSQLVHLQSFNNQGNTSRSIASTTASFTEPFPLTLEQHFAQFIPPNLQWVLHHNIIPADLGKALAKQIHKTAVLCIADGSFKEHYGTAAFILDANNENNSWLGVVPCYGDPSFHDAYRSEITGLLAIVTVLLAICRKHHITEGIVHIGCDNDSALARCLDEDWTCQCPTENWDVIQCTRHIISQLPISLFPVMVTGHLDKNIPYEHLNRKEQLNVDCDTLAKLWWKQTHSKPTVFRGKLPGECRELSVQGMAIKQHLEDTIFAHCSQPAILQTWQLRRNMSKEAQINIDWPLINKAMKRIPHARRLFVVKHVADRSATGVQMKRRQQRQLDHCPRCQQNHENNDHVLLCQQTSAQEQWVESLGKLEIQLAMLQAPTQLSTAIISFLDSWRDGTEFHINPTWDIDTQIMMTQQQTIGGKLTLEGCIHSSWQDIIQLHLTGLSSKVNGERFVTSLIRHLWQIAWDMWDHRNRALHELEVNEELRGIKALDSHINELYYKGVQPLMTPDEKVLFHPSLDSLLRLQPPSKRAWIATVEASLSLCIMRHNSFMPREREFMRTFLERHQSRI